MGFSLGFSFTFVCLSWVQQHKRGVYWMLLSSSICLAPPYSWRWAQSGPHQAGAWEVVYLLLTWIHDLAAWVLRYFITPQSFPLTNHGRVVALSCLVWEPGGGGEVLLIGCLYTFFLMARPSLIPICPGPARSHSACSPVLVFLDGFSSFLQAHEQIRCHLSCLWWIIFLGDGEEGCSMFSASLLLTPKC